jgi:hypothetical protein
MEGFGEMSLRTFPDLPHQWQGSTLVDYMEHQGDTPTPHDAPIHHQDERLQRQTCQQDLGERDKIYFLRAMVVLEPSRKAFGPAFGLGTIGHVRGNVGQLRALAPDDATDQRGEGRHVPGDRPCRLVRIPL